MEKDYNKEKHRQLLKYLEDLGKPQSLLMNVLKVVMTVTRGKINFKSN